MRSSTTVTSWPIARSSSEQGVFQSLTLQFEPPAADPLDARRVKRLLRVHVIIERVDEDLGLTLRLHECAHHTERTDGGAVPEQEAGNDGVVGPLAAGKAVVACGVEREVRAAVLERDARPRPLS